MMGQRKLPEHDPWEKIGPQFLLNMDNNFENVRMLSDSFVKEHRYLDDQEKKDRADRIYHATKTLAHKVLGLARNRGERLNLLAELRTVIQKPAEGDTNKLASFINNTHLVLEILQARLEQWNMLLTLQAIPENFAVEVIAKIGQEERRKQRARG